MESLPAVLQAVLCHPLDHTPPVGVSGAQLSFANGDHFPVRKGIPNLTLSPPFRHRFWCWLYNRIAFGYDLGASLGWRLALGGAPIRRSDYLVDIRVRPADRVLETAVGTGANIERLSPEGSYVGLDISLNMLLKCRQKLGTQGRRAALVQSDMQQLPFLDDSFDVVFHMGGLQFVQDPKEAVREMLRVAKPGTEVTVVDEVYSLRKLKIQNRKSFGFPAHENVLNDIDVLIPEGVRDVRRDLISEGELYRLRFIKTE